MPQTEYFVIKDTVTELFLTRYSTNISFCQWGNPDDAVQFSTLQQAEDTIDTWDGAEEGRFTGTNPPPR